MLRLKGIHYHPATSERPILTNLSFEASKGIPIIISGPSGSGKTSLIEVISGLSKPQKGKCSWENQKLSERHRRAICGVIFQFPERHFIGRTVSQELRIGHRRLSGEMQYSALRKVGLCELNLRQAPENLSGGQQRRLSIAVQLLKQPKILLLDEPTAGLDWSVRGEILELIKKISLEQLIIVVTHERELYKNWTVCEYQLSRGCLKKI